MKIIIETDKELALDLVQQLTKNESVKNIRFKYNTKKKPWG